MIRYYTAGESHGKSVTVIIEGIPAGLAITAGDINHHLARRQKGYGRGKRMQIETDKAEVTSGIRWGETLGSPICLVVKNKDWENWTEIMSLSKKDKNEEFIKRTPRPGHADLSGMLKYDRKDMRDILERASARETAARVAAGAVAKKLLEEFNIYVVSFTKQIGKIRARALNMDPKDVPGVTEESPLRCIDKFAEKKMVAEIKNAGKNGDTVGGIFSVVVQGAPPGLGSHTQWDLKLDGRVAQALMSVQAIKGVEVGRGFDVVNYRGSKTHDEIKYDRSRKQFFRMTNNAGGIEGGMSNGEVMIFRGAMKPISSLMKPLKTVDLTTKKSVDSAIVRSDICAVPAAGVVGEAVVAIEVARAMKEKFGGDSLKEMKRNYQNYIKQILNY
ncbi:MAG: chorismate synthase [Elusimicrobia bacterium]|jgi:chorismate synthase|nr:chorismate synthase [Elusimicrobiota bacterium]